MFIFLMLPYRIENWHVCIKFVSRTVCPVIDFVMWWLWFCQQQEIHKKKYAFKINCVARIFIFPGTSTKNSLVAILADGFSMINQTNCLLRNDNASLIFFSRSNYKHRYYPSFTTIQVVNLIHVKWKYINLYLFIFR